VESRVALRGRCRRRRSSIASLTASRLVFGVLVGRSRAPDCQTRSCRVSSKGRWNPPPQGKGRENIRLAGTPSCTAGNVVTQACVASSNGLSFACDSRDVESSASRGGICDSYAKNSVVQEGTCSSPNAGARGRGGSKCDELVVVGGSAIFGSCLGWVPLTGANARVVLVTDGSSEPVHDSESAGPLARYGLAHVLGMKHRRTVASGGSRSGTSAAAWGERNRQRTVTHESDGPDCVVNVTRAAAPRRRGRGPRSVPSTLNSAASSGEGLGSLPDDQRAQFGGGRRTTFAGVRGLKSDLISRSVRGVAASERALTLGSGRLTSGQLRRRGRTFFRAL